MLLQAGRSDHVLRLALGAGLKSNKSIVPNAFRERRSLGTESPGRSLDQRLA